MVGRAERRPGTRQTPGAARKKLITAYRKANEPLAYGLCGLTPEQFGHTTPARFYRIADAKIKQRNEEWKFMDTLNAVQCAVIANVNRGKNTPAFKPDTFRVFLDRKKSDPEDLIATMDRLAARQEQKNG